MNKDPNEITQDDKEVLMNQTPPQATEGGSSLDTDKDKKKKKKKGEKEESSDSDVDQTPTPELEGQDDSDEVDILGKEADTSVKAPGADAKDYSLSPDEFRKKYIDIPDGTTTDAFDPRKYNSLEVENPGEGVEDYRKYLRNPIKSGRLDYNRALMQSNTDQLGNAIGRFVVNVVPEIVQQAANIVETPFNWFRDERGNPISEAMQSAKDTVSEEWFPIYQEDPEGFLNVGDFAWWADRGSSLSTSVVAFLALGYATGGSNVATRMANGLGRIRGGANVSKFLKGNINGTKAFEEIAKRASLGNRNFSVATIGDAAFNSWLLTSAESTGTAFEVYQQVLEESNAKYLADGLSEEEAAQKAKEDAIKAGDRAFNFNQWNIALNLTSVMPFLRGTKNARFGAIPERTIKGGAKRIGVEGLQEYAEESVNFLSERYARDDDYNFVKAFKDLGTEEGIEAGILGLIGGVAQTGLTLGGQYMPLKRDEQGNRTSDYNLYKERYAAQEDLRKQFQSYAKEDKINELDLFYNLKSKLDLHNKIAKLEEEKLTSENPAAVETELDQLKAKLFTQTAYQAFTNGLGQEFRNSLEALKGSTVQEDGTIKTLSEDQIAILDEKIQQLNALENIYNATKDVYLGDQAYTFASEAFFYKDLKEGYQAELNKLLEKLNPMISEITGASQDAFTFDTDSGTYKFDKTVLQAESNALNEQKQTLQKQVADLGVKIANDEKRIKEANVAEGVDNTQQINALQNQIDANKEIQETAQKELEGIDALIEEADANVKENEAKVERLIEKLSINPAFGDYFAIVTGMNELAEIQQQYEDAYDNLMSFDGQKKAREAYKAAKQAYNETKAKEKAATQQAAEESEFQQQQEQAEKDDVEEEQEQQEEQEEQEEPAKKPKGVRDEATALFSANPQDITVEMVQASLPSITNGEVIETVKQIISKTDSKDLRERLLIGAVKKFYTDAPNSVDAKALTNLYMEFDKYYGGGIMVSPKALIETNNNFVTDLNKFLDDNIDRELGQEIDYSTDFNLDPGEKDTTQTSLFREYLENQDKDDLTKFTDKVDYLLQRNNLDMERDSFRKIARTLNDKLGADLMKRIYYKLQGYYQFRTGKRVNRYYETTVLSKAERLELEKERAKLAQASSLEDYEVPTAENIAKANEANVRAEFLMREGIELSDEIRFELEYEDDQGKTQRVFTTAKNINPASSVAYKLVDYTKMVLKPGDVVDTVTAGEALNFNTDSRLIKRNGIRPGDVVEFFVVEGTTTTRGGTEITNDFVNGVWKTSVKKYNQPSVPGNPIADAPIGIKINGTVLEDAYLHVPSFINEKNVLTVGREDNVIQREIDKLTRLRTKILAGEDISTQVVNVKRGHFYKTSTAATSINMPNVPLGIYNGSVFKLGDRSTLGREGDYYVKSGVYAMIPEEDGSITPYGLRTRNFSKRQAERIARVFSLRLLNEEELTPSDLEDIELFVNNGFDLRDYSKKGHDNFNKLMRRVMHITYLDSDNMSITAEAAKPHSDGKYYPKFFMGRGVGKGLVFKAGMFRNTHVDEVFREGTGLPRSRMQEFEGKLVMLLTQTRMFFDANSLGKDVFLPFTDSNTDQTLFNYDQFIRDNTTSDIRSIRVDNQDVYRLQKTVEFDLSDFEFEQTEEEERIEIEEVDARQAEEDFGEVPLDDSELDFNLESEEDESLLSLDLQDTEDAKVIVDALEESSYIKGLPVAVQEDVINGVIGYMLRSITKDNVGQLANLKSSGTVLYKRIKAEITSIFDASPDKMKRAKETRLKYLRGLEQGKTPKDIKGHASLIPENKRNSFFKTLIATPDEDVKDFLEKSLETLDRNFKHIRLVNENIDKIFEMAIYDLYAYQFANVKEKENNETDQDKEADNQNSESVEGGDNVRVNYDNDFYLGLNGKDQLTTSVKLLMMGIPDTIVSDVKYETRDGQLIKKVISEPKKILGFQVMVPFDKLYEEVMVIISNAYNNYEEGSTDADTLFEYYMKQLLRHKNTKPYLENLVEKLRKATKKDRNAFVSNMNKAAVNHITNYMITKIGPTGSRIFLTNKRTNVSESSDIFIKNWEQRFYDSDLVESKSPDGTVVLNEEKVKEYFEKANGIVTSIYNHISTKRTALRKAAGGDIRKMNLAEFEALLPDEDIIASLKRSFADLGFNFSDEFLYSFYTDKYYADSNAISIKGIMNPAGFLGAFKELIFKDDKVVELNRKGNSIFNDGYLRDFAKFYTSFDQALYSNSYTDAEGKTIYGYSLNKFLTDRTKGLKSNKNLIRELREDTFQGESYILDMLHNEANDTFNRNQSTYKFFNYFTFSANSQIFEDEFRPNKLENLSEAGYEQVALSLFYNKGNRPAFEQRYFPFRANGQNHTLSIRNGRLFAPTFSDKRTVMGFDSPIFEVEIDDDGRINNREILDFVVKEVVKPEYNRILEQQFNENEVNIDKFKEGSKLFYFIPELNYDDRFWEVDEESGLRFLRDLTGNAQLQAALVEVVERHIDRLAIEKVEKWQDYQIISDRGNMRFVDHNFAKRVEDLTPRRLALEYEINYLISNANFFKLFAGDPAQYYKSKAKDPHAYIFEESPAILEEGGIESQIRKRTNEVIKSTFDNVGKRLAAQIAPGTDVISERNEKIKFAILQDLDGRSIPGVSQSLNLEYYRQLLGTKVANDNYARMNAGDAMAYITFDEWLDVEYKRGVITMPQKNELAKRERKEELTEEDIELINKILAQHLVNSYKPVYFNNYKDDKAKKRRSLYVKMSAMPLIKQLTQGQELDVLRNAMVRDGVQMVAFESAVKTGATVSKLSLYDNNGRFKDDFSFVDDAGENLQYTLDIPRQGLKIQQDMPIKTKNEKTDGSQQRKLIFADLLTQKGFVNPRNDKKVSGETLQREFNSLYVRIFKTKFDMLANELEWDGETINIKKLQERLMTEFRERGYPPTDLYYLGIEEKVDGTFVFRQPLWTSGLASKIESLLISIVNNDIRTLKSPGHSFILGAHSGLRPKVLIDDTQEFQDFLAKNESNIAFDKEWYQRGDFVLKGQHTKNGVVQPAEIMIPSKFKDEDGNFINAKDLMDEDGFIDQKKVPKELLTMFGYRIPTQGLNSMAYMKVVGLLPETYSDMLFAPPEFTAQMGSDFDIDKLFVDFHKHKMKDGKLKKATSYFEKADGTMPGEFLKLTPQEQVESMFNSILDIKLAILSNPDDNVQRKILSPLDENEFEAYANDLEATYGQNNFYSPISQPAFKAKFLNGTNGNEAIGVFARASTLNAILQSSNKDRHFLYRTERQGGFTYRVPKRFALGIDNNGKNLWNNSLSNPVINREKKGATKAEVISTLLTNAVDNENLQILGKLNINSQTYNVWTGLIQSGFSAERITYFMNQPVIRDYVALKMKVQDVTIRFSNADMYAELHKKYPRYIKSPEEFEADPNSWFKWEKEDWNSDVIKYTLDGLKQNIKFTQNDFVNPQIEQNWRDQQSAILFQFHKFEEHFKPIRKLTEAVNIDGGNALGNSIFYAIEKDEELRSLPFNGIQNAEMLLGTIFDIEDTYAVFGIDDQSSDVESILEEKIKSGEVVEYNNQYLIPRTILGGMYAYALRPVLDFYSGETLFPYNSKLLSELTRTARRFEFTTIKEDVSAGYASKELYRGLNKTKQFLFSNLFENLYNNSVREERERLLVDNETPSLATILDNIKEEQYQRWMQNPLLSRLEVVPGGPNGLGTISFRADKQNTQMIYIGYAIAELLQDNSVWYKDDNVVYTGAKLALDLIRHQYLTKSIQFRREFLRHIPGEVFEALGVNEKIRNFELNNEDDVEPLVEAFETQLAQHYPSNLPYIKPTSYDKNSRTIMINLEELQEETGGTPQHIHSTIAGVDAPFTLVGGGTDYKVYRMMDIAGEVDKGIVEYDSSIVELKSVVPSNDIAVKEEMLRLEKNTTELQSVLSNEAIWQVRIDGDIWQTGYGTKESYHEMLKAYEDSPQDIRILSEKSPSGLVTVYDTARFKGVIENPTETIKFADKYEEGVDYVNTFVDRSTPEELLSPKQKFKRTFNVVDGQTEESMIGILEKLKQNSSDVTRNYLYDVLIDAIPSLVAQNPNMKLRLYDSNAGSGSVRSSNGQIAEINLNVRLQDTLILDDKNMNKRNIHNVVVEEFLHAFTKSEIGRNSQLVKDFAQIRSQVLTALRENNPDGYAEYLKTKERAENQGIVYTVLQGKEMPTQSLAIELRSINNKEADAYKRISERIKEAQAKNEAFINIETLRNELIKEYEIPARSYREYYALTNTTEFIAGVFYNKNLQDRLNLIEDKKGKTILEKIFDLILRVLNRLTKENIRSERTKHWDRLIKTDVNKNSLLQTGLAKGLLLVKSYNKSKFKTNEKAFLQNVADKMYEQPIAMSTSRINTMFNLREGDELQYVENGAEVAAMIRKLFGDSVQVKTHKKNYVYVTDEVVRENESLADLALAKTFKGGKWDGQQSLDLNSTNFNLEREPGENDDDLQQKRVKRYEKLLEFRKRKLDNMISVARSRGDDVGFKYLTQVREKLTSKERVEDLEAFVNLTSIIKLAENDLQEVEDMLAQGNIDYGRVVYIQQILTNWKNSLSIYFTEDDELYMTDLLPDIRKVIGKSTELENKTLKILTDLYERGILLEFGKEVDLVKYMKDFEDVNVFRREGVDISRVNNTLLSYIHTKAQRAFNQTKRETHDKVAEIDKLLESARPILEKYKTKKNGLYDILMQKYDDGTLTGDLINPFSKSFLNRKAAKTSALFNADLENRTEVREELYDWINKETLTFNTELLYNDAVNGSDAQAREAHIAELKEVLGESLYEYFRQEQDRLYNEYFALYKNKREELEIKFDIEDGARIEDNPVAASELREWVTANSPVSYYRELKNGKPSTVTVFNDAGESYTKYVYSNGHKFIVNVPKRQNDKGKDTGYYDDNFDIILRNPALLEFYKGYTGVLEELKVYLPTFAQQAIAFSGLPELRKSFMEVVNSEGLGAVPTTLVDNFKEDIRVSDLSEISNLDVDPITGREQKILGFNLFKNNYKEWEIFYRTAHMEYVANNDGQEPPSEFKDIKRKEFNNMVAERKTKDLGKVLRAFAGLALTYKHKSRIADVVVAGEIFLDSLEEPKRNPQGNQMYNNLKQKLFKPKGVSYENTKEMYAQYVNAFFESTYKLQGVSKKRTLTSEETKRQATLEATRNAYEELIDEANIKLKDGTYMPEVHALRIEYLNAEIQKINQILNELGGNVTLSKTGDQFLKFFQLKGMGWNLLAGIGNLGYGVVGNFVEASDGRIINMQEMREAYSLVMNSVGRNATFNKWNGRNSTALKIRNVMDRNDVLKEASHELYANSVKGTFGKKLRFATPYNMQKRTEYLNQAPIMVAFYKKTKVQLEDGTEISLWDAYDNEGQWKSEYGKEETHTKIIDKTNAKITQFIKRVHGNYDPASPLKLKQGIAGRAAAQFRTWFFEAWQQRWQAEEYDEILETTFKGRYMSIGSYMRSKRSDGSKYGFFGMLTDLLKGMLLTTIGRNSTFDQDGISEVDAANMRKVVTEIQAYLTMYAAYLGLSLIFRDDEVPEGEQEALNLTLNTINRVRNELTIYFTPDLVGVLGNPAPSMSLLTDLGKLGEGMTSWMWNGDTIESGVFAGESRFKRSVVNFTPFMAQFKSMDTQRKMELNKSITAKILKAIREAGDED